MSPSNSCIPVEKLPERGGKKSGRILEKEVLGHKGQFKKHAKSPTMGIFSFALMLSKYKQKQ